MRVRVEEVRRRFRARGLRVTPQRIAIYRALAETTRHPTAYAVYRQVKRRHPLMSPNTVYYTLGALLDAGLVQEVNYWHDGSRFDANLESHHHVICLGCRTIRDVSDHTLDRLTLPSRARTTFDVRGHRVVFHGYCAACRKKAKKAEIHHHS